MAIRQTRLGEALASLGVIGSLIFVGLEIRQNTKALEAAAIQSMTDVFRDQAYLFINDSSLNSLVMRPRGVTRR
ncbi:MAG: hypothetical protein ABFS34_04940 [Gemmatimonadota bacterium]